MSSLDEIKRKKLEELMRLQHTQNSQQASEQAQLQQQVAVMEEAVRQFLDKDALVRYGNLKSAHKEKALQLIVVLYQAIAQGQIKSKITDEILKNILQQMEPKKRDFKISRV